MKLRKKNKQEAIEAIPHGKPKSGRVWKTQRTKFSSIKKSKGLKSSFEKKKKMQTELARVKQASKDLIAAKREEKEQKKERRRENLKRQKENQRKAEVVQVITNTAKLKKMRKKQLRHIEKRDTNL